MNEQITIAPPENIEAEQQLLGAILLNNAAYQGVPFLEADHFSEPVHRIVYQAIAEFVGENRTANPVTLKDHLPYDMLVGEVKLQAYVARLCGAAATPIMVPDLGRVIFENAMRRRVMDACDAALAVVGAPVAPASLVDVVADLQDDLNGVSEAVSAMDGPGDRVGPDSVLADIRERMTSDDHYKGATSGFVDLDRKLTGFAPGQMVLIAGRPAMGKSAVGLAIARNAARRGHGVGFLSIEMSYEQNWHRLLSDEARSDAARSSIAYQKIGAGRLSAQELAAINAANDRLKGLPLILTDTGDRLADLQNQIRKGRRALARMEKTLDVFIVDYIGLLRPSERYRGQKVNEVGEISAALKRLAKKERLAILALHQLSRATEQRENKRPQMSDLRDSGNLEQDADAIIFVYRPAYYVDRREFESEAAKAEATETAANKLELIVSKNRQGPTGTVKLWCDMATNSIRTDDSAYGGTP